MFSLEGRTALITGAGQNVGEGIALMLARQGAAVYVNDVVAERAEKVAEDIRARDGRSVAVPFDVTDHDQVVEAIDHATGRFGPVDILVNNAGNGGTRGMTPTPFRESTPDSWRGPIDVNLYGVLNCCHVVVNAMCERGWGRVITIASGAGLVGLDIGVAPYGAGKGGAIGFMRHLAIENARHGVTANTLAIGLMSVPDRTVTEALARRIPVGRVGRPDDIAAACVWLASEEAEWVTGQTIQLNGGSVTS